MIPVLRQKALSKPSIIQKFNNFICLYKQTIPTLNLSQGFVDSSFTMSQVFRTQRQSARIVAGVATGIIIATVLGTMPPQALAQDGNIPNWAQKNTLQIDGSRLSIVCSGRGPSVDLARAYAIRNCRISASDTIQDRYAVQGLTIESDKDVGFHQEVESKGSFKGLSCQPVKDEVRGVGNGLYEVWLKCNFDLGKIQRVTTDEEDDGGEMAGTTHERTPSDAFNSIQREQLVGQRAVAITTAKPIHDGEIDFIKVLDIVSIPPCNKILIRGEKPRSMNCSAEGITSLTVTSSDKELIIQSPGFLSKTFKIPPGMNRHETIQVILEPKN